MKTQHTQIPRHIFVADDDIDDRLLLAEVLLEKDNTLVLTEAENGKVLMDILNLPPSPLPDLVFLDLNMPIKNGFECLAEIRSGQSPVRELIVMVLSTSSDPHSINKAFRLGATYYAIKPNTYGAFRTLVDDALKMVPVNRAVKSPHILCA